MAKQVTIKYWYIGNMELSILYILYQYYKVASLDVTVISQTTEPILLNISLTGSYDIPECYLSFCSEISTDEAGGGKLGKQKVQSCNMCKK